MSQKKEYPEQVARARARQKAVESLARTPEADKYCLGPDGTDFGAMASRVRQTMLAMERSKGLEAPTLGAVKEKVLSYAPLTDSQGGASQSADIAR